jgi:DNA-binding CsgD family transcriptional regulator
LLSERERQILEIMASGATSDLVARQLWISRDEVRALVRRSLQTVGARSRLELVLLALHAGVIHPSEP